MHHPVRNPVCNCEVGKLAHWHTRSKPSSSRRTRIALAQQMEYLLHRSSTPEQKGRMYVYSSARYQAWMWAYVRFSAVSVHWGFSVAFVQPSCRFCYRDCPISCRNKRDMRRISFGTMNPWIWIASALTCSQSPALPSGTAKHNFPTRSLLMNASFHFRENLWCSTCAIWRCWVVVCGTSLHSIFTYAGVQCTFCSTLILFYMLS